MGSPWRLWISCFFFAPIEVLIFFFYSMKESKRCELHWWARLPPWKHYFIYIYINLISYYLVKDLASMFMKDTGLQFYFLVMSLYDFGIRIVLASYNKFGSCFLFVFWKIFIRFLPLKTPEFSVFFEEYKFKLFSRWRSIQIFCFFLWYFWYFVAFKGFFFFFEVVIFTGMNLFIIFLYYTFNDFRVSSKSDLILLVSVIYIFPLYFWTSLARSLSVFLIFSES